MKILKISILVPTRGRPERALNFCESVARTQSGSHQVVLLFYCDSDDSKIPEYQELLGRYHNVILHVGEPQSVSKSWNVLAKMADSDILIMGNDDQEYQTENWDLVLQHRLWRYPDQIYCAWFNDGINGERHCAFPIVSRKWYKTVGNQFTPGIFNFGYNDTWIFDVGKRVGRLEYIEDVFCEHQHFTTGKSEYDDTYARNRTQERGNLYDKDSKIFAETASIRQEWADKLKKEIGKHHE